MYSARPKPQEQAKVRIIGYPYPELLLLLQILTTPEEHQQVTRRTHRGRDPYAPPAGSDYWDLVPSYTYAECPCCAARYQEPADTHTLQNWGVYIARLFRAFYVNPDTFPLDPRCPHFLGIDRFVNLHGLPPLEPSPRISWWGEELPQRRRSWFENSRGEIPFLTPWFFPSDIPGYAVLHALPICRAVDAQFVPSFTVFILTYFSEDPQRVIDMRRAGQLERMQRDSEYYPIMIQHAYPRYQGIFKKIINPDHDLERWARQGQLGWLDFTDPQLPLQMGGTAPLPSLYRAIAGNDRPYACWDGRMRNI